MIITLIIIATLFLLALPTGKQSPRASINDLEQYIARTPKIKRKKSYRPQIKCVLRGFRKKGEIFKNAYAAVLMFDEQPEIVQAKWGKPHSLGVVA